MSLLGLICALCLFFSQQAGISVHKPNEAPQVLSLEEATAIICQPQYLWDCDHMVLISFRESRFSTQAVNYDCYPLHINPYTNKPYICIGMMQIIETNVSAENLPLLYDPYYNVSIAYKLWLSGGYEHWTTR